MMARIEMKVGQLIMVGEFANIADDAANRLVSAMFNRLVNINHPKPAREVSVRVICKGEKYIELIKEVRHFTGYGLKEAKDFCDTLPKTIGPMQPALAKKFLDACLKTGADAVIVK